MGWLATDKQQQKAKMPAAGATQALSAVLQPVGGKFAWPKDRRAVAKQIKCAGERMPAIYGPA